MSIRLGNFYYNISGEDAERLLLEYGVDGSFLARPSVKTPGDYSLSVRRNGRVTHIRIQRTDELLDLYGGEKFATLSELIQYYMENKLQEKNGDEIILRYPLSVHSGSAVDDHPAISSGLTSERWFHVGLSSFEAEKMLREQGKFGSFLVRESQSNPGQYAISVRLESKVTHVMVQRNNGKFDVGGGDQFETLQELLEHYKAAPMVESSGDVVHLKAPLAATRFPAITILERVPDMATTKVTALENVSTRGPMAKEFDTLEQYQFPKRFLFDRKEGCRPENVRKNRYKNIVPHDHTRIVLTDADPNIPGSDYINANLIRVLPEYAELRGLEHRRYISTQGCLNNTVDDLWRMIWQQNSRVIVMATREMERSRPKCFRYWSDRDETRYFGLNKEICVSGVDETVTDDYALRRLSVTNVKQPGESRVVYQWQFLKWPDHGCPQDPGSVLNFLDRIGHCSAQMCPPEVGPIIVHCSAGIGRTGTIIAIDLIVTQIKRLGLSCAIDVAQTVRMLREQRSGMVQTEQQYEFIYVAVRNFVDMMKKRIDCANRQPTGHEYTNICYPPQLSNEALAPSMSSSVDPSSSTLPAVELCQSAPLDLDKPFPPPPRPPVRQPADDPTTAAPPVPPKRPPKNNRSLFPAQDEPII